VSAQPRPQRKVQKEANKRRRKKNMKMMRLVELPQYGRQL
jgi:hypothetical protein